MQLMAVYTTVATREDAQAMARALVERHLAACAQISAIESFYEWQGQVQHEAEFRILFKTTEARRAAVEAAIRELHRYEVPAIYSVALQHVDAPFAEWVEVQCAEGGVKAGP